MQLKEVVAISLAVAAAVCARIFIRRKKFEPIRRTGSDPLNEEEARPSEDGSSPRRVLKNPQKYKKLKEVDQVSDDHLIAEIRKNVEGEGPVAEFSEPFKRGPSLQVGLESLSATKNSEDRSIALEDLQPVGLQRIKEIPEVCGEIQSEQKVTEVSSSRKIDQELLPKKQEKVSLNSVDDTGSDVEVREATFPDLEYENKDASTVYHLCGEIPDPALEKVIQTMNPPSSGEISGGQSQDVIDVKGKSCDFPDIYQGMPTSALLFQKNKSSECELTRSPSDSSIHGIEREHQKTKDSKLENQKEDFAVVTAEEKDSSHAGSTLVTPREQCSPPPTPNLNENFSPSQDETSVPGANVVNDISKDSKVDAELLPPKNSIPSCIKSTKTDASYQGGQRKRVERVKFAKTTKASDSSLDTSSDYRIHDEYEYGNEGQSAKVRSCASESSSILDFNYDYGHICSTDSSLKNRMTDILGNSSVVDPRDEIGGHRSKGNVLLLDGVGMDEDSVESLMNRQLNTEDSTYESLRGTSMNCEQLTSNISTERTISSDDIDESASAPLLESSTSLDMQVSQIPLSELHSQETDASAGGEQIRSPESSTSEASDDHEDQGSGSSHAETQLYELKNEYTENQGAGPESVYSKTLREGDDVIMQLQGDDHAEELLRESGSTPGLSQGNDHSEEMLQENNSIRVLSQENDHAEELPRESVSTPGLSQENDYKEKLLQENNSTQVLSQENDYTEELSQESCSTPGLSQGNDYNEELLQVSDYMKGSSQENDHNEEPLQKSDSVRSPSQEHDQDEELIHENRDPLALSQEGSCSQESIQESNNHENFTQEGSFSDIQGCDHENNPKIQEGGFIENPEESSDVIHGDKESDQAGEEYHTSLNVHAEEFISMGFYGQNYIFGPGFAVAQFFHDKNRSEAASLGRRPQRYNRRRRYPQSEEAGAETQPRSNTAKPESNFRPRRRKSDREQNNQSRERKIISGFGVNRDAACIMGNMCANRETCTYNHPDDNKVKK